MFKDILGEQALNFEFDVNVCRYVDGEKELLNEDGQITVEKAEKLMKEKKATFQFHQPQRYAVRVAKIFISYFYPAYLTG